MFFFKESVAVSEAVSHSAVWEMQSVGQISRSGGPAAVANENPQSIAKKIIASRNHIPSFVFFLCFFFFFWEKDMWEKCESSSA